MNLQAIHFLTMFAKDNRVWEFYTDLIFKRSPELVELTQPLQDGRFVTIRNPKWETSTNYTGNL